MGDAAAEHGAEHGAAWNAYVCRSGVRAGRPHPGKIVEPASLAAVALPPLTYPVLDSVGEQVESGALSQLQLEGVAYACQRHQHIMPNGSRSGFFIGDATGTGKGRQIAGIVVDNMCRGRRRHLWCSTSADLVKDAMRDFADLDANVAVHDGVRMLDKSNKALGVSKEARRGVLFTTYASLVSSTATKDRFDQITSWLGDPDSFEGCLIFDECHKAKNFAEKEGKGSRVAKAVVRLQRKFPRARCVYVSATGVSDIGNMAYMDRLGLWGKGAAFESFDDFRASMGKRNMGALEMLAIELKSTGHHVSRGLSFADTTFDLVKASLTADQLRIYCGATQFWNDLRIGLAQAVNLSGVSAKVWGPFWSAHQRFFKQLCIAFKVPDVVRLAKQALAEGHCVVIGLQSTSESAVNYWTSMTDLSQRAKTPICFVGNLAIVQFIQTHFPLEPADYNIALGESLTLGGPTPNRSDRARTLRNMYTSLLARASALELPASAIDDIIHQLGGYGAVAEMTGRRSCIEARRSVPTEDSLAQHAAACGVVPRHEVAGRKPTSTLAVAASAVGASVSSATAGGATAYPSAAEMDSINICEKEAFMAGKKLVAVISDAAGTGISLHADQRVANQRRRIHITCELAWAADTAVQQLGRSHRSSQVCAPMFKLVTSGIGGENRFISAVASRLRSLGALTHGDRRASTAGVALDDFVFDSLHGTQALQDICANTSQRKAVPGVAREQILQRIEDTWTLAGRGADANEKASTAVAAAEAVERDPRGLWTAEWMPKTEAEFVLCTSMCLRLIFDDTSVANAAEAASTQPLIILEADRKSVNKFLNKMLGLPVHLQAFVFEYFSATLDSIVEQAKLDGTYDEGVSDVHANSVTVARPAEVVYTDPATGGELKLNELRLDRGVTFESAMSWLERAVHIARDKRDSDSEEASAAPEDSQTDHEFDRIAREALDLDAGGFYVSEKSVGGKTFYALAVKLDPRSEKYSIFRPNTGRAALEMTKRYLRHTYVPIRFDKVRSIWQEVFTKSATECSHGSRCPAGESCTSGKRFQQVALLTGAVLPLWTDLAMLLKDPDIHIPRADRHMRVIRAQLDSGERAIGIKWHVDALKSLRQKLAELNARLRSVRLSVPPGAKTYPFSVLRSLAIKPLDETARQAGLRVGQTLVQVGEFKVGPGATREQVYTFMQASFDRKLRTIDLVVRNPEGTTAAKSGSKPHAAVFQDPTPINPAYKKALLRKQKTILGFFAKKKKPDTEAAVRPFKRAKPSKGAIPADPEVIDLE